MERFPRPEILRVPLESICLTVKATREKEDVKVCNLDRQLVLLLTLAFLGIPKPCP
jgi:hypothetical protein